MRIILLKIINKLFHLGGRKSIHTEEKAVYLTFDDGPEPGITEFVLDELNKYGYKGTFFCRGDNAERYPEMMRMIVERGHAIGNHTYRHLHAYESSAEEYLSDVKKADSVLHTNLFRPPHGSLTLQTWWKLRKRKIFFWALNSEDSLREDFNLEHTIENMKVNTHAGDVVLFHFCNRHEKETRQILPVYLKWLDDNGFDARIIF